MGAAAACFELRSQSLPAAAAAAAAAAKAALQTLQSLSKQPPVATAAPFIAAMC